MALIAQGGRKNCWRTSKPRPWAAPGWALLTHNRRDGKLHTYFVAEHHIGMPIDQDLLLVLDSWEHAFMVDFPGHQAGRLHQCLPGEHQVEQKCPGASVRHNPRMDEVTHEQRTS
ncbi:MAG: hypothetical protein IPP58_14410 [Holophagaceae bacterium]|uniref:Manganese/iron superoxide dismutase C-terminal domain-containing protein n=1 Tax=Candidatus Geothrix skivensis TaxID=2954439 RepID=A0A9D7SJY1_9BACT|nr:hypothetical protein [Candidatus Geothrix skivensis]